MRSRRLRARDAVSTWAVLGLAAVFGWHSSEGAGAASEIAEPWRVVITDRIAASREIPTAAIIDARLGDDGTLYALGRERDAIYVVTVRGESVRVIGGPGDGPGRFREIGAFGVTPDSLWVIDRRKSSLASFDLEGNLGSERRLEGGTSTKGLRLGPEGRLGPDGLVVAEQVTGRTVDLVSGSGLEVARASIEGDARRPLTSLSVHDMWLDVTGGGRTFQGPQPWSDADRIAVDPRRRAVAVVRQRQMRPDEAPRYVVSVWSDDGRRERTREIPFEPLELDDRDVRAYVTRITDAMGGSDAFAEALRDELSIPEKMPALAGSGLFGGPGEFIVGSDGGDASRDTRVWVRINEKMPGTDDGSAVWHVIDPSKGLEARVLVPRGVRISDIRGSNGVALVRDSLDISEVVLVRVDRVGE